MSVSPAYFSPPGRSPPVRQFPLRRGTSISPSKAPATPGWRRERVALQPDGKLLFAGNARKSPSSPLMLAVWRFHSDGSPDTSFNETGRALPAMPAGKDSRAYTMVLQSDGRILVGGDQGTIVTAPGASREGKPLLARFLPDGRPDPSFGPNSQGWFVLASETTGVQSLGLQPDGKILSSITSSGTVVLRHHPNGTLDASFGGGQGAVRLNGSVNGANPFAVQGDGKILIGRGDLRFYITRLLPNGAADATFGTNGNVMAFTDIHPRNAYCRWLSPRPDGTILAAGPYSDETIPDTYATRTAGFMLARLLPNGTWDESFGEPGTLGRTRIRLEPSYYVETPFASTSIHMQSDGRILAAGVMRRVNGYSLIGLTRFSAAGLADGTFGNGGRVVTDFGPIEDTITGAGLLTDQKFLVAGARRDPDDATLTQVLVARYHAEPTAGLIVEYPPGSELWEGGPPAAAVMNFGPVTSGTKVLQLMLRNAGLTTLTNLQAAITSETVPGEYRAVIPSGATLVPGAQAVVNVSLTPLATPGHRNAILRLTTTTPGVPPRMLTLTGLKATPFEIWRVTWFGSPDNSGPGADANDFDGDGLPNFMEYATQSHPHAYSAFPCQPAGAGAFTYMRPAAAPTEFSWHPEAARSPNGPWSEAGLSSTVLTDDGTVQTVRVELNGEAPDRVFLRLRVLKL